MCLVYLPFTQSVVTFSFSVGISLFLQASVFFCFWFSCCCFLASF